MSIDVDLIKRNISRNIVKYREISGFSQKELAKRLSVTPSRVSNWEQGANCPSIDILFDVCKVLGVSINDIYGVYPDSRETLSYSETEHIKKYRSLDDHGKEMVDIILAGEYKRLESMQKNRQDSISVARNPEAEYLSVNAAHNDGATWEQKESADRIMMDDSEWE